jgi:hypothetical protein
LIYFDAYPQLSALPKPSERQIEATGLIVNLDRTITYQYDHLYRLSNADYSTGESYAYEYDPVGNRLARSSTAI